MRHPNVVDIPVLFTAIDISLYENFLNECVRLFIVVTNFPLKCFLMHSAVELLSTNLLNDGNASIHNQ